MNGFPGGFVAFFESVSNILKDLGDDWISHSDKENDNAAKNWGNVFLEASKTIKNVSETLAKIRNEHDINETEKEIRASDPIVLIENFKKRVMREHGR